MQKAVQLSKPLRQSIAAELRKSDILHFDETGVRVAVQLQLLHVASIAQGTQLMLHSKRGQEALKSKASLWKDFRGVAVHDGWSAYFNEGRRCHALCGAHLLCELAGLQEQGTTWAAGIHEFLLGLHDNSRRSSPAVFVFREYHRLLEQTDAAEPQPWKPPSKRGRPKATKGRNLLRRLQQHEAAVLRFALEEGVPFTNKQA